MRLHALWISFAFALVGCGGEPTDDVASSSGSGTSSGGGTDPFIGVYDATYSGTSTNTSPPGAEKSNTGTGVITVEAGTSTDLKMTISYTGATQATCVGTFARDGNTATFSPMQQGCDLTVNGGAQTNTNSGDATVSGSTLSVHVYGSYVGTSMGAPYEGTFDGSWTGTRR